MPIPVMFEGRLAAPAIAAPMFLVSNPDLVVETCRAGLVGTFPSLNQRTADGYESWLAEIAERLARSGSEAARQSAPFGVNLIVNKSNPRLATDLAITVRHRVPLVITSLGAVKELVDEVHGYGGLVFHDVINVRHARKAAEAGVDGIIAVCAGAGGHAGTLTPFGLLPEIRSFFPKTLVLSGAISTGAHIAAARMLGADLAYLGTRFIAAEENAAVPEFKHMILASQAADIVYTAAISGVHGNFLKPSIDACGVEIDLASPTRAYEVGHDRNKAWKTVWSAGQGVGSIQDVPKVAALCARLVREYEEALAEAATDLAALRRYASLTIAAN